MKEAKELLEALMNNDFETLVKHFPEAGLTPEDLELDFSFAEDARYNYPERERMKDRVLEKVLKLLPE